MLQPLLFLSLPALAVCTSSKMDFLPLGHVRTDPVTDRARCDGAAGLSPHVHTFYGAAASLRPDTSWDEMRNACGNSGNVDDNKSLYWHPTIYRFDKSTGLYHIEDIYFASAYYVWRTPGEDWGPDKDMQTKAFPDGFQMIAKQSSGPKARVKFDCNGPSMCEEEFRGVGNCEPIHTCADDSRDENNLVKQCFPAEQCSELEIKIVFPACWDGVSLTSSDYMSHVAYGEGTWSSQEGAFEAECPSSHPVRVPEIQMYFRIKDYAGGAYTFSDGTTAVHTDYFSGWDEAELQTALDSCVNDGEAAMSNRWCEEFFSFRDEPKLDPETTSGDDGRIVRMLEELQPDPPLDLRATVASEQITGVSVIPTGRCEGTLVAEDPSLDWRCTENCSSIGRWSGDRSGVCPNTAAPEDMATPPLAIALPTVALVGAAAALVVAKRASGS